jgi:hypothetical protein
MNVCCDFGTYDHTVNINPFWEDKIVSIDKCIYNEVINLWEFGIETIESCCGHCRTNGYIAVKKEYISRMEKLNYIHQDSIGKYNGIFNIKKIED